MGIMGKLFGGAIGFALGGPLGAVAGAVFGHAFDKSNDAFYEEEMIGGPPEQQAQLAFFVGAFSMLAKLARSDGRVTAEEVNTLNRFMVEDLHLDPQSRRVAMEIFQTALNSGETFEAFAHQFYQYFKDQPQMLDMMVDIMVRLAHADSEISANEERLIQSAVHIFNMSADQYRRIKTRHVADNQRHYAVLGCDPDADNDQIKSCYRRRVSEYHPDKIASKGLPEEFTEFAEAKFREIQEAYDAIKAERNIR